MSSIWFVKFVMPFESSPNSNFARDKILLWWHVISAKTLLICRAGSAETHERAGDTQQSPGMRAVARNSHCVDFEISSLPFSPPRSGPPVLPFWDSIGVMLH